MINPATYNAALDIRKTHELYVKIYERQAELDQLINEWEAMKKKNAENISISWKESILKCLSIQESVEKSPTYFLRTAAFLSNCVAWDNAVNVDKDLKNNVSSTLSLMFKNKEIGRYEENGKKYYGLKKFFNDDLTTIKDRYAKKMELLAA